MRPWVTYSSFLQGPLVLRAWSRTMCRLGVHLFDEVYSFGAGRITPEMIAGIERTIGYYVAPANDDDSEERYLSCDACGLSVPIGDEGGAQ